MVFAVDAPWMSPFARSSSTQLRRPKVRAPASSAPKRSGVTAYRPSCTPIRGCGKSIRTSSSSPSAGVATYTESPSTTRTGSRRRSTATSPPWSTRPASIKAARKGSADPSMMGGSAASIAMVRSSMASPATAASTCSTVWSASAPSPSWVRRSAATATETCAGIIGAPGRSVRRKRTPSPTEAGSKVRAQGRPRWSPVPATVTGRAMVRRPISPPAPRPRAARAPR